MKQGLLAMQARSHAFYADWGRLKFLGGNIVTGHHTQLTIAITDSTTTMKMTVQNNVASKASRKKCGLYPQL